MLDALSDHGRPMERAALAEALEMTASGGTFSTYLSRLRTNGLIRTGPGGIELSEVVQ